MTSLRERQLHMTELLKKLDRMIVEKHGRFNLPFFHYQKPLAAPGERDTVCVYVDSVKREYLPYGHELEKMVEDARLWVRTGEGPRPEVMIVNESIMLARSPEPAEEKPKSADAEVRGGGSRRKLINLREAKAEKHRARPPV